MSMLEKQEAGAKSCAVHWQVSRERRQVREITNTLSSPDVYPVRSGGQQAENKPASRKGGVPTTKSLTEMGSDGRGEEWLGQNFYRKVMGQQLGVMRYRGKNIELRATTEPRAGINDNDLLRDLNSATSKPAFIAEDTAAGGPDKRDLRNELRIAQNYKQSLSNIQLCNAQNIHNYKISLGGKDPTLAQFNLRGKDPTLAHYNNRSGCVSFPFLREEKPLILRKEMDGDERRKAEKSRDLIDFPRPTTKDREVPFPLPRSGKLSPLDDQLWHPDVTLPVGSFTSEDLPHPLLHAGKPKHSDAPLLGGSSTSGGPDLSLRANGSYGGDGADQPVIMMVNGSARDGDPAIVPMIGAVPTRKPMIEQIEAAMLKAMNGILERELGLSSSLSNPNTREVTLVPATGQIGRNTQIVTQC